MSKRTPSVLMPSRAVDDLDCRITVGEKAVLQANESAQEGYFLPPNTMNHAFFGHCAPTYCNPAHPPGRKARFGLFLTGGAQNQFFPLTFHHFEPRPFILHPFGRGRCLKPPSPRGKESLCPARVPGSYPGSLRTANKSAGCRLRVS